MAMDYLWTATTSKPSERVSSVAGRDFMWVRQTLSWSVFVKTVCARSWMRASIINVPVIRAAAVARASKENDENNAAVVFEQMTTEQEDCGEKIVDD